MEKASDYIKFKIAQRIKSLYKNYLFLLEDLREGGDNISEEKFALLRKRVLDHGNDCVRELIEDIDKLDMFIKNNI